jgi:hypothetical protein
MAQIEEQEESPEQIVARGRDEKAPIYVHFGVLIAVGVLIGVVVGLVFLAQALA